MTTRKRLFLTILAFVLISLVLAWIFRTPLRQLAFAATGEEQTLGQVRGLLQYATNWTRPQPDTRPTAQIAYSGVGYNAVSPFGVNTFLEQEVEPAKRERQMQMIAGAGFKWIRQEFPWADIEIGLAQGKFNITRDPATKEAFVEMPGIEASPVLKTPSGAAPQEAQKASRIPLRQFVAKSIAPTK